MVSSKIRMINLPKIEDQRGNLTFIEECNHVPFKIKRVYYVYDIPGGESRGGHAHKRQQQFIIALSGSFDVILDDGIDRGRFPLNRSYYGIYVPELIWRELENFATGSVCLVLSSGLFDEDDYIRDYNTFAARVKR